MKAALAAYAAKKAKEGGVFAQYAAAQGQPKGPGPGPSAPGAGAGGKGGGK